MPSAVDNIIKAAKSAALAVAEKYGPVPTKLGEPRTKAGCRKEVLAAAVKVMTDKQKELVANLTVEEAHLLIAAILISAGTSMKKTPQDQINTLKELECISQDGLTELKRAPSWPTVKDLQTMVAPPKAPAAKAEKQAPAAKVVKRKLPQRKPKATKASK